jgi:cyclopropane-fatty-acyl-phospholipid synthase
MSDPLQVQKPSKSMALKMDEGTTRKSYARSLLALADTLTMGISGLSYGPITSAARLAIVSMMSHSIRWGRLRVLTAEHGIYTFPSYETKPFEAGEEVAEIRVIRDSFWLRLVTLGDLGFAEAYMAGDCEVSDLVQIFKVSHIGITLIQIFIRSRPSLQESSNISGVSTIPSRIFSMVTALTNSRFANTLSNSLSNIKAHYDLSNGMFSAFLSRDMTYSCAIYPELDRDLLEEDGREAMNGALGLKRIVNGSLKKEGPKEKEGDDLEEAQIRKLRHIIKKADIRPGHRVLEIGSGWGSLSMEAVKMTNCTVDTLTLSEQQKALAEERIKKAGLAGRIRVWLMDYRAYVYRWQSLMDSMPESWKGQFDRVISIEMIEAVGYVPTTYKLTDRKEFTQGYFSVIDWALNERGVACIQAITIPEARFAKCTSPHSDCTDRQTNKKLISSANGSFPAASYPPSPTSSTLPRRARRIAWWWIACPISARIMPRRCASGGGGSSATLGTASSRRYGWSIPRWMMRMSRCLSASGSVSLLHSILGGVALARC